MEASPRASLAAMAPELLNGIAEYLPDTDKLSLIRVSWLMHDITARILYRHISLKYVRARKFFKTVVESLESYGKYTRSLQYSTKSNAEVYLTYWILCAALQKMDFLQSLTLAVSSDHSRLLMHLMDRFRVIGAPSSTTAPKTLSHLRVLSLNGDIKLTLIAANRSVTRIRISLLMDMDDLNYLISAATGCSPRNTVLRELFVTLDFSVGKKIGKALTLIGSSFPSIRELVIQTPTANALEASAVLASSPSLFKILRRFSINEWSLLEPVFSFPLKDVLELQRVDITRAGDDRYTLTDLVFGTVVWKKAVCSDGWLRTFSVAEETVDRYAATVTEVHGQLPLFWCVTYKTPERPLSETPLIP